MEICVILWFLLQVTRACANRWFIHQKHQQRIGINACNGIINDRESANILYYAAAFYIFLGFSSGGFGISRFTKSRCGQVSLRDFLHKVNEIATFGSALWDGEISDPAAVCATLTAGPPRRRVDTHRQRAPYNRT